MLRSVAATIAPCLSVSRRAFHARLAAEFDLSRALPKYWLEELRGSFSARFLIKDNAIDLATAEQFAQNFGAHRLTFAVDSKGGKVAIKGWREITSISPKQR